MPWDERAHAKRSACLMRQTVAEKSGLQWPLSLKSDGTGGGRMRQWQEALESGIRLGGPPRHEILRE